MNPYRRHRFPPDIISYAVWLYDRFNLSHRDIEDLLAELDSLHSPSLLIQPFTTLSNNPIPHFPSIWQLRITDTVQDIIRRFLVYPQVHIHSTYLGRSTLIQSL